MIFPIIFKAYTVYMCFFSNSFHFNICVLYGIFMLHWFELTISRILVYPYQEAILLLTPPSLTNSILQYTFDDSVVPIPKFDAYFHLLIGGGIRARYMLLVCFALPCVAIERCLATWLVRDYEQKSRAFISVTLILISEILATVGAYTVTFKIVGVFYMAVTAGVLQTVSYGIVRVAQQRTKYIEKKCERSHQFYSLSVKFQITENVKSFRVIHILVVEVALMILTASITIALAGLNLVESRHTVYVFFFLEKLIQVNPLFICTAVFCIKPHWFRRLLRLIPFRLKHRTHAEEYVVEHSAHRCSLADAHFEQLKKLW
ncbi:hypothetical protein CRE_06702 [Caenorhabditis remanei]|uniref:G protein-coupled receptor n=1 Tax=Caenorhabditis remanei TaxID=31234 RepID=E3M110_CAERE|nr:hypothetical protein CRE_06702 [Caenorhabditis remanei]